MFTVCTAAFAEICILNLPCLSIATHCFLKICAVPCFMWPEAITQHAKQLIGLNLLRGGQKWQNLTAQQLHVLLIN